jgi:uncharacterized protein (DUF983 family)
MTAIYLAEPGRPIGLAFRRGFMGRCPHCGVGKMFRAYLKVNDACPSCGEALHHQRADDMPPYLTMLIVGHCAVAALVLSLILLPRIKGALIGYQWAMRMHGFGGRDDVPG